MKVYIGPYYHWLRPARWYKDWILWAYGFGYKCDYDKIDVDALDKLTEKIHDGRIYNGLMAVERWIENRHKRKIAVKIHDYDVWGMDGTLALIVLPMLKLLKEKKNGAPYVDDDDVPVELQSTAAPPCEEWETDDNHFKRWDWVMDEMIWAFEQIVNDDSDSKFFEHPKDDNLSFEESVQKIKFDKAGYTAWQHRKQRGLLLFGKYFEALWD